MVLVVIGMGEGMVKTKNHNIFEEEVMELGMKLSSFRGNFLESNYLSIRKSRRRNRRTLLGLLGSMRMGKNNLMEPKGRKVMGEEEVDLLLGRIAFADCRVRADLAHLRKKSKTNDQFRVLLHGLAKLVRTHQGFHQNRQKNFDTLFHPHLSPTIGVSLISS